MEKKVIPAFPWQARGNDVYDADGMIVAQAVSKQVAAMIAATPALMQITEDLYDRVLLDQPAPTGILNVIESVLAKAKGIFL